MRKGFGKACEEMEGAVSYVMTRSRADRSTESGTNRKAIESENVSKKTRISPIIAETVTVPRRSPRLKNQTMNLCSFGPRRSARIEQQRTLKS